MEEFDEENIEVPKYDPQLLNISKTIHEVKWETLPDGKKRPLIPGIFYRWRKIGSDGVMRDEYYVYAGTYSKKEDAPTYRCAYTVGNLLFHRSRVPFIQNGKNKQPLREDNSRVLNVDIKPDDNELMVLIKEALRGTTIQQFKLLFDNVTEMNNMRRAIEYGDQGNLSWNRFKDMVERLGDVEYVLELQRYIPDDEEK